MSFISWLINIFNKPKPPAPSSRPIMWQVYPPVSGVEIAVDGATPSYPSGYSMTGQTDAAGQLVYNIPADTDKLNVHIIPKDSYKRFDVVQDMKYNTYVVGDWPNPIPADWVELPALVPIYTVGREAGVLTIDNLRFKDSQGALWQWRGITDFLLFFKFLQGDVQGVNDLITERLALGANVFRVLGMVDWAELGGQFHPQNYPDYYTKLGEFADLLASRGVRFEFVVFADAQLIMPDYGQQDAHAQRVFDTLKSKWNVFIEWVNEPFKNINGESARAYEIGKRFKGQSPVLMASGHYGSAEFNLDYMTIHTDRGSEWPRKMKDAVEAQWAFHILVIADEPMGADETDRPGSRSADPHDFFYAAGVVGIQTNGATFHFQDGLHSDHIRPVQADCARHWFGNLLDIGPEPQTWTYTAGHLGNCPIEHSDDLALRTFAQLGPGQTVVQVVRPTPSWRPVPRDGWRLTSQSGPEGSFLRLTQ